MPENTNLVNEIVYSDNIEYDVKKQLLDAINTSKNILSHIKTDYPDGEKYNSALNDYNNLKNEIQKAYMDDQKVTREELEWLKDEILAMDKYDERGFIEKRYDSAKDYLSINNDYTALDKVESAMVEINNKDSEYFYVNQERINYIDNPQKLDQVIDMFIKHGEKLNATKINKKLFDEFASKEWVELDPYNVQFLEKNNLEKNLGKILQVNKEIWIKEFILLQACKKWIDATLIKNVIKEQNINVQYLNYIKIYIWEQDTISEQNFTDLYKSNWVEGIKKLPPEKQKEIIDFLSKNINEQKYENTIIDIIKNTRYYAELRILDIHSTPILKALIDTDIDNIRYITNEKIKDKEIIDCFLENLNKKSSIIDGEEFLWKIDHINRNFDNIEWTLYIFNYIKNNIPQKYEEVKSYISDDAYIKNFVELFKNSKDLKNRPEYLWVYNDIENVVNDNMENIVNFKNTTNEFNVKNQDITKEWFSKLNENLGKKLNWLDEKVKKEILKEIEATNWKFTDASTEKIYNILKNAFPDYKNNPEFEKYFNIIQNEIKNFNIEKAWNLSKSVNLWEWWGGNKYASIDKNWITTLNEWKLKEDYLKLIEWKNEQEKVAIREKFIKDNFAKLKPEEIAKIREILDTYVVIDKIEYTQQNFKKYVEYMDLKAENPDLKMDFKKYVETKDKLDNPSNNYFIPTEESYVKTWSTYSLEWKNWEIITWLTEKEKQLTLWNPEATENLINFFETFKELNLESIWDYREELLISIWNNNIDFSDSNFVSQSELIRFGNTVLKALNNILEKNSDEGDTVKLSTNNTNISSLKNEFRKFSWANSMLSQYTTYNILWEDKFAATLRQLWILWWAYFKTYELRSYLK